MSDTLAERIKPKTSRMVVWIEEVHSIESPIAKYTTCLILRKKTKKTKQNKNKNQTNKQT